MPLTQCQDISTFSVGPLSYSDFFDYDYGDNFWYDPTNFMYEELWNTNKIIIIESSAYW